MSNFDMLEYDKIRNLVISVVENLYLTDISNLTNPRKSLSKCYDWLRRWWSILACGKKDLLVITTQHN